MVTGIWTNFMGFCKITHKFYMEGEGGRVIGSISAKK
jgi:hypothetical protein